jgi:hypothetical protein
MHTTMMAGVLSLLLAVAAVPVGAQVAGSTTTGVSPDEVKTLARGWSAKKQILGKPVYNDQDERVGEVEDLIVTPDKSLSYAIIGVGGFLGMGTRTTWRSPWASSKAATGKSCSRGSRRTPSKRCRPSNTRNKAGRITKRGV